MMQMQSKKHLKRQINMLFCMFTFPPSGSQKLSLLFPPLSCVMTPESSDMSLKGSPAPPGPPPGGSRNFRAGKYYCKETVDTISSHNTD